MASGDTLGASGGQKTTKEAPKTILASKMGGPGLQKGAKMEAKMLLKINQRNDAEKIWFWFPKCFQGPVAKQTQHEYADAGYSGNLYDIRSATKEGVVYPSMDPSCFELKFPNLDIQGRVVGTSGGS